MKRERALGTHRIGSKPLQRAQASKDLDVRTKTSLQLESLALRQHRP